MAVHWKPEGYHSVAPYLIVPSAEQLIDFVKTAFGAEQTVRMEGPDGKIAHAEVRIGDSVVMVGNASGEAPAMPTMLYLYLEDTDAAYQRALDAGATSVEEPNTAFYGDRRSAVTDPGGNKWYIATKVEDVSEEEMAKRAAQQAP